MTQSNEKLIKRQKRITIILSAIISPLVFYKLYTWSWLIEALRTDDYSYGGVFYLVVASLSLLCNYLIVKLIFKSSTHEEKIRLWLKASLIAFTFAVVVILVTALIYLLVGGASWNFG